MYCTDVVLPATKQVNYLSLASEPAHSSSFAWHRAAGNVSIFSIGVREKSVAEILIAKLYFAKLCATDLKSNCENYA